MLWLIVSSSEDPATENHSFASYGHPPCVIGFLDDRRGPVLSMMTARRPRSANLQPLSGGFHCSCADCQARELVH
jgi:hypothetical protein